MDQNQLNLLSYPNWFGNVDFDLMYETYLGDSAAAEAERQMEKPLHNNDDTTWWEKDYEDWSQSTQDLHQSLHSGPSAEPEAAPQFLPDANTEFFNFGLKVELPKHLEGDYDSTWSARGVPRDSSEGILGATGFCMAGEEEGPVESQCLSRGSGSGTPDVPEGGSASDEQESFEDLALEDVLHYLGEYEDTGSLRLPGEHSHLTDHHQFEPTRPTRAVDSQHIPADEVLFKLQASRKHRVRGPKNWEFLMRLLMDPRTNPSLIEWEDEEQGIFRLRNPKAIAQIWASRNENATDLSYNNFARGLRHHYKKGILIPIPERQLVYQCGQQALEFLNHLRGFQ